MKNYGIGFFEGLPIEEKQVFQTKEIPMPSIGSRDLLVEIEAVSVNPVDTKLRKLTKKSNKFHILGYDACGKVAAIGEDVEDYKVGDRVLYAGTTKRDGSNQKFQAVDERIAALVSSNHSSQELAALPLTSITAWELLFEKLKIKPIENGNQGTILLINGSGGVGSIASQLARWAGLKVYATGSEINFPWLKNNGVEQPISYHRPLNEQVNEAFDYIAVFYDISDYLEQLTSLIKPLGKIGMIVNTKSAVDLNPFKNLSVDFYWEYMFTKTDANVLLESQGEILKKILHLLEEGKIHTTAKTILSSGITVGNLIKATKYVEAGIPGQVVVSGGFIEK